jgi:hypothetical protein
LIVLVASTTIKDSEADLGGSNGMFMPKSPKGCKNSRNSRGGMDDLSALLEALLNRWLARD